MDYEKAYKEALDKFKKFKEKYFTFGRMGFGDIIWDKTGTAQDELDAIFPELKESEDERIRKGLIEALKASKTVGELKFVLPYSTREECIAYLEKQKINTEGDFGRGYDCGYEACLNSHGAEWLEKQKEQKHPGGCFTCDEYKKGYEEGRRNGFTAGYNKAMKEVEQKEQKQVESCSSCVDSEYDKGYQEGVRYARGKTEDYTIGKTFKGLIPCWVNAPSTLRSAHKYHGKNVVVMHENNGGFRCVCIDDDKPVTFHLPEDTLFCEGWRKKQEWSEIEVEFRGEKVKVKRPFFRDDNGRGYSTTKQDDEVTWNALRAWAESHGHTPFELYPKEEWSEEDEEMRDNIICILHKDVTYMPPTGLNSCAGSGNAFYTHQTEIDWLKSLRPSWKPSEEQMKALRKAVVYFGDSWVSGTQRALESLYEQLKKLKEDKK